VDITYQHAYIGVASSALVCRRVAHGRGELGVAGHGTTLRPVVVVVPPVETAVMRARSICRRGILRCICVLLRRKNLLLQV
jgi:hypothetical protein